jgi:hypothetical protein
VVPFEFLNNEVLIDGQFYPVVKMNWVNGTPLHHYINQNLNNNKAITQLQYKLSILNRTMEAGGISHGDLKYNNIIIQPNASDFDLKLIDYDTMFIPAFDGKQSMEIGSPGFQPLKRLSSHFSPTLDRFSIWVILTTLEAIKLDPSVWVNMEKGGFNNEHSLFSAADFLKPDISPVFQKLRSFQNVVLNTYLDKLLAFSKVMDFSTIALPEVYEQPEEQDVPAQQVPQQKPQTNKPIEVEIKTIPSGKDVLINGQKKGITPLRVQLTHLDKQQVVVMNDGSKVVIPIYANQHSYELDFSKKTPPKPVEQDEILEFKADKYTVEEGEQATINWRVKGSGKIHISNMGEVQEKTGSKRIALRNTTNYVLTVGEKNRSLTINVQPKLQVAAAQSISAKEAKPRINPRLTVQTVEKKPSAKTYGFIVLAIVLLATAYLGYKQISKENTDSETVAQSSPGLQAQPVNFTTASIRTFLDALYTSYNKRDLLLMTNHYATTVQEYYDSKTVSRDSLQSLMKDLFLSPASYRCTPDFSTLQVQPQTDQCKVIITVKESLQTKRGGKIEKFTSRIEYVIDRSYKIVSEKHLS